MNSKENPEKKGMIPRSMREKRKCFYSANKRSKVTAGEQKKRNGDDGLCAASKGRNGDKNGQAGNDVIRMRCDGGCNVYGWCRKFSKR